MCVSVCGEELNGVGNRSGLLFQDQGLLQPRAMGWTHTVTERRPLDIDTQVKTRIPF